MEQKVWSKKYGAKSMEQKYGVRSRKDYIDLLKVLTGIHPVKAPPHLLS